MIRRIIILVILVATLFAGIALTANWEGYGWASVIICIVLGVPILYVGQGLMDRKK